MDTKAWKIMVLAQGHTSARTEYCTELYLTTALHRAYGSASWEWNDRAPGKVPQRSQEIQAGCVFLPTSPTKNTTPKFPAFVIPVLTSKRTDQGWTYNSTSVPSSHLGAEITGSQVHGLNFISLELGLSLHTLEDKTQITLYSWNYHITL